MISPKVQIIRDLRAYLEEISLNKKKYTTKENAFTKPKKLTFTLTILFLLNIPKRSLGIEIDSFFEILGKEELTCTKSAISQARYKLNELVFKDMNIKLQQSYYKHNSGRIKRWSKYELQGVDGTTLQLMDNEKIREEFGCQPNQHGGFPMARVLARVDVLNEIIIDGKIGPLKIGETEMAVSQLDEVPKDVISIYDRNFASYGFIHEHIQRNCHYVIRCKLGFNNVVKAFVSSGKDSTIVNFHATEKGIKYLKGKGIKQSKKDYVRVRLVRVELNTGETEILITSLLDEKEFPTEDFGEIYNYRWGTETCFDTLKNKLQINEFSGHSPMAIYQDFHATILFANINTVLIQDCDKEVEQNNKDREEDYKINKNVSIGLMKDKLVRIFIDEDQQLLELLKKLKTKFLRHVEPVRLGRSYERNYKSRARRTKYHTLTNYRRAI